MLLVLDCIISESASNEFQNVIIPRLQDCISYEIIHIKEEFNYENFDKFSHLLISGSELSASQGSEWDEKIISLIKWFVKNKKAVFGICYGHQMIARALAGDQCCRRTVRPEFGWIKIPFINNPIFEGFDEIVVIESHYDEVCNLPDEFLIIAQNEHCAVQAFQYKNYPVWGVQFHPEQSFKTGTKMMQSNIKTEKLAKKYYENHLKSESHADKNIEIIKNFLRVKI